MHTMERTVPVRSSEEIDLYLRTIYSLLRSSNEVHIRTLEEVHAGMNSSLHTKSREDSPDISALLYALMRLPEVIFFVKKVVLGQSAANLASYGYGDVETWQQVSAKARRRRCFYDGGEILACYIASRSDIDDVVPALTALRSNGTSCTSCSMPFPKVCWLKPVLPTRFSFRSSPGISRLRKMTSSASTR